MEKDDWPYRKYGLTKATNTDQLGTIALKHFIYLQHDKKKRAANPKTGANSFIFRDLRFLKGDRTLLVDVLASYEQFMFTNQVT